MPSHVKTRNQFLFPVWLAVCGALLGACAQPLLNSERIEQQFGSYNVALLESSAGRRVSNLYSLNDDRKICRTLALVTFEDPTDARISLEQRQISSGASIGAVFKNHGWTIYKTNLYVGMIHADEQATLIANLMNISLPQKLALHLYRFELVRGSDHIDYAIIAEIHHPDYLSPDRLQRHYGSNPSEPFPDNSLRLVRADLHQLMQQ
jgi:hypothetical protein